VVLGTVRRARRGTGAAPSDDPTRFLGVVPGSDVHVPGGTRPLPAVGDDGATPEAAESAFFTGTPEGKERSRAFGGPGQDVIDERERTAEHAVVPDDDADDTGTGAAPGRREDPHVREGG